MTDQNIELLNLLGYTQYVTFLRAALGFKAFLNNDIFKSLSTPKNTKEIKRYLGEYNTENNKIKYCVVEEDYKQLTFRDKDRINEPIKVGEFFSDLEDSYFLWVLLSSLDFKRFKGYEIPFERLPQIEGMNILANKKIEEYRFILGAGVNLDQNLGITMGNWNDLVESMRNATRNILNIPSIPSSKYLLSQIQNGFPNIKNIRLFDDLTCFEESICNTNYMGPQILKDLDAITYYQQIHNNLYPNYFNVSNLDIRNNNTLIDTSLFQVARIIDKNGKGKVLTFNYDNVLEEIIDHNFNISSWESIYSGKKETPGITKSIVHSHGFFPYRSKYHGIILSTFEYIKGYTDGRYPYKKLKEQLEKTNYLIGNSLSDYEEQKVFSICFNQYPSNWHFMFTRKENNNWINAYKTVFFMRMGVIPVYFNNFSDMTNYLKTL